MNLLTKHPKLLIGTIVGFLILVAGIVSLGSSQSGKSSLDTNKQTQIKSPFAQTENSVQINSGLDTGDPNADAVQQPFSIFGLETLPIPTSIQYALHEDLLTRLTTQVVPTYARTYLQLDRKNFNCLSEYDCKISFYLDSPERYYEYHFWRNSSGGEEYSLKQMPLPGVSL